MDAARRTLLLMGLSSLAAVVPGVGLASASASRQFKLSRDGSDIGEKSVVVARDGSRVSVATRIDIAVTLFGLRLYSYRLRADEVWEDGVLQSLDAETNDNGTAHFARARRGADGFRVEGSVYSGAAPDDAATTSYWSPAFLARPVWISTQDGRLLQVRTANRGTVAYPSGGGTVQATRWEVAGDLDGVFLYYDAAGEWLGTEFPARGATARFTVTARGGDLTPLWVNA